MAYQGSKPAPAKILRTPAPDEITNVRHPSAAGPGMNGPQPSFVAPGQASEIRPRTEFAAVERSRRFARQRDP